MDGQFSFSCITTAPICMYVHIYACMYMRAYIHTVSVPGKRESKSYMALVPHFGMPVMMMAG